MKKLFVAVLVVGLLAAVVVPALTQEGPGDQEPNVCDVSFDVDVAKYKDITEFTKEVDKIISYEVDIEHESDLELPGFSAMAEVEVFKCDLLSDNSIAVFGASSANNISDSFNGFTGVAQLNLAAGFLNNQGNVFAAGLTGPTNFGLTLVEAAVEKTIQDNSANVINGQFADNINGSFNGFTGLAQVNLAAGILNNQNNVMVLGVNLNTPGLVAENDTFLSMHNSDNSLAVGSGDDGNGSSSGGDGNGSTVENAASLTDSFNGATGVAQVNLGPGIMNNQANIISIAFAGRQAQ